jgi:hypothetical protein
MRLVVSIPSGFHLRELVLPLKAFFEQDAAVEKVIAITPGAPFRQQLFGSYGDKFEFVATADEAAYAELYRQLQPDLVVTTTAGLDERDVPILRAAQKRGIKTFTFIASWDNVWKMERLKKFGKPYVLADHLVVWNRMMFDHLYRVFPQLRAGQVSIIGAPRFDYFWHADKIPSRDRLFAYLGLAADGEKLIHIGTTELYPMDYIVAALATRFPKAHLYASVHPGGDMKKHQGYAAQYGVTVRYSFGRQDEAPAREFQYNPSLEDIYMLVALFKHSDVLVNHSSTVALESLAADVPVINVKFGEPFDWWRWYRSMVYRDFQQHYRDVVSDNATTIVKNSAQLAAATETYLGNPALHHEGRRRTLQKMITTTDGSASQQMFELIKKQA